MAVLDRFRLDGQVVLLTGAGRGLGRAMALAFADAGATVAGAARTAAQLEETAGLVRQHGGRASVLPTDVTDADSVAAMVQATLDEFGRVDVLVNNAGAAPRATASRLSSSRTINGDAGSTSTSRRRCSAPAPCCRTCARAAAA